MLKKLLTVICSLIIYSANATDSLFVVKDTMLLNKDYYRLRPLKWKYHEGKNEKWVLKDFDDSGWQEATLEEFEKMKLNNSDYCFRLHFKTDSSNKESLYMRFYLGVPSLVFLNGKQSNYYGEGFNFKDYHIDNTYDNAVLIDMYKENVVVIYSDLSARNFLINKTYINPALQVAPQIVKDKQVNYQKVRSQTFSMMLSAVLAGLALLTFFSWFLVFQDRQEKSMVWIAVIVSIILLNQILSFYWLGIALFFKDITLLFTIYNSTTGLWVFLIAPVISNIVNNRTDKFSKIFFVFSLIAVNILSVTSSIKIVQQIGDPIALFLGLVVIIYIIILFKKNRSKLSKPQWTVMIGLAITILSGIITVSSDLYFSADYQTYYLLNYITYLSFPVSLLIYASLKLRQNFVIIREKANQITQLSIEKEKILKEQNEQLEYQVETRTAELKASQNQLIQKEKLAGLGELTAGIAHEIQNPLNFVNNFSEVSTELMDELKEGPFQKLPDSEKGYAEEILGDLTQNLQKIMHHGKRASSIVKGMLEHSRTGTGERVATDLNKLADEYLRLSYHGMRAKNNNFQADFELLTDPNLPFTNVVPQEIGRVLMNLLNNAFYAVGERSKKEPENYRPKVKVVTSQTADAVTIQVQDNGLGIPESVKAKIFQPFFTTKPTGEGTGLGLSLSYDIVTKGHGGTLMVESIEGLGSEFIITLPIV